MAQLLTENLLLSLVGCALRPGRWPSGAPGCSRSSSPPASRSCCAHIHVDARVLGFALAMSVGLEPGVRPPARAARVAGGPERGAEGGRPRRQRRRAVAAAARCSWPRSALSMVLLVGRRPDDARLPARAERPAGLRHRSGCSPPTSCSAAREYFDKTPQDMNLVTPAGRALLRPRARAGARASRGHAAPASSAGFRWRSGRIPSRSWAGPRPSRARSRGPTSTRSTRSSSTRSASSCCAAAASRSATWPRRPGWPWSTRPSPIATFPARIRSARRSALDRRSGPGGARHVEEPQPREIVGVVADVTYPSFFTETPAAVYIPFRQHVWQYGARGRVDPHAQGAGACATVGRPADASCRARRGRGGRGGPRPGGARLHDHGAARRQLALGHQQPLLRVALHHLRHRWPSCSRWSASTA